MPSEMVACPHCGTPNSSRKQVCYHCRRAMATPADLGVTKRALRARTTPPQQETTSDTVQQRPLTAGTVITGTAPARETATASAKSAGPEAASRQTVLFGVSLRQRAQLFRQLYALLKAGMPLALSLHHLEANCAYSLRPVIRELITQVEGGGFLSEKMARYPSVFAAWEVAVVRAGEKSGGLWQAMLQIAEAIELEAEMRARVHTSTFHLKATVVVFILVFMIVMGIGGVQGATSVLDRLSVIGLQFLLLCAAGIGAWQGWKLFGRSRQGGYLAQEITARLPLIGPIIQLMRRIRFLRVLSAMWNAGVSPLEALSAAAEASGNPYYQRVVQESMGALSTGASVSDTLEMTRILPPEAMSLLRSGEVSGSVSEALDSAASYLELDLDGRVKTLPAKAQLVVYGILVPIIAIFVIWFYTQRFAGLGF